MKRKSFIALIAAFIIAPVKSKSATLFQQASNAFKTDAGTGRRHGHLKLKGVNANVLDVKVSGKDTNGGIAIFEQTSLSQGRGTPTHVHPLQDEVFYVIEGEYFFKVGDAKHKLKAGDTIFLPRQVPHAWTQLSATGKMLVTLQPAGKLEDFFVTMAGLNHEPSKEEVAKIFAANEMQVVGPPVMPD